MSDNPEFSYPSFDPNSAVFRSVHLVGGPLNGQVKRFQIVSGERTGEIIGFKDKVAAGVLHFYKNREPGLLSSRDTWADYSHSS